jgi:hypothetical protein
LPRRHGAVPARHPPHAEIFMSRILTAATAQRGPVQKAETRQHVVARMFGDGYSRQGDRFNMCREGYVEWVEKNG